ncbi:MAG: alpha/beta hydrolase [Anaerolineales bacterium]|nr:alpha/beta hydrolase [Anaerolineales bacterium]
MPISTSPADPAPLYRSPAGYAALQAHYEAALARGPVPYTSRWVETRFGRTHVVVGGPAAGPPVVVFHGWNSHAAGAGADFPFLFDAYRVYLPDIIGQAGRSAPTRPDTAGPAYAEWAVQVLDGLGLAHVRLVGISGGGWLALKLAGFAPHRVTRVLAVSSAGLSPLNVRGALRGMLPLAVCPNAVTARWFVKFAAAPHTARSPLGQALAGFMALLLRHFKTQANPGQLTEAELHRITAPVLLLIGEHERLFHPHIMAGRARRLIPNLVAAEVIPNAGHLLPADQPEVLKRHALAFLRAEP